MSFWKRLLQRLCLVLFTGVLALSLTSCVPPDRPDDDEDEDEEMIEEGEESERDLRDRRDERDD